jgi:hypothetical protein
MLSPSRPTNREEYQMFDIEFWFVTSSVDGNAAHSTQVLGLKNGCRIE